ncbi:hypothetical protein [Rubripirellula obstinata]|uniref:hypothetical protein n=1 Tax=Rubripirellula obstinata TaxID=406547 RepID=UPI00122C606E|nr:hypothetical protein [Rubripirellula obstinata]
MYDSALEDLHEAEHALADLDEETRKRESWECQDIEKAEATPFDHERKRYRSQAKEHASILANLQTKANQADGVVAALQDRLADIEDRLLEP